MPSNQTPNYQLSQWSRDDRVLMEDFNADNAKIDAALKAHDAALAGKGDCQFWTTSYMGDGKVGAANPRSLSFPKWPRLVFIVGGSGFMLMLPGQGSATSVNPNGARSVTTSWSGSSVSWYGGSDGWVMMNSSGTTYQVVALLPA